MTMAHLSPSVYIGIDARAQNHVTDPSDKTVQRDEGTCWLRPRTHLWVDKIDQVEHVQLWSILSTALATKSTVQSILSPAVLDHTRIMKYHTLKYVRIVKKYKIRVWYAYYYTGRHKDKVHIRSIRKAFTIRGITQYPKGAWHFQTKSAAVNRRRKIAVLRQEFEKKICFK